MLLKAESKLGPDVTTHCMTTVLDDDKQLVYNTADYATVVDTSASPDVVVPDCFLNQVGAAVV